MELYFLARCAQMMLLKQCIRRAVQEGLVRHFPISIHAMFFSPNSVHSAMPALLTCPAASELAAPGGPEIDVSEVIRKNLERTRSQEGWFAEWAICIYIRYFLSIQLHIYIYHLLFLHAGSCTCRDGEPFQQRIGDGTGQGPQPVLIESNKMLFFNAFFFVLTVRMFRLCILGLLRNHLQTRRIGS